MGDTNDKGSQRQSQKHCPDFKGLKCVDVYPIVHPYHGQKDCPDFKIF